MKADPAKPFLDALDRIHRIQRCPRLRRPHHAALAAWVEAARVAAEDALEAEDAPACILTGAYDRDEDHPLGPRAEHRSWCGRIPAGWCFTGPTHAALNGRNEGRIVPCPACVREIARALGVG